ncbi:MAG TPA: EamA family transporter [Telluria sp.]|nr:EamA family transporter [Telluria sp.]
MKRNDLLLALGVAVIWGANFSVIKTGLATVDPFLLTALRFLFCSLPLVFFVRRPALPLRVVGAYGLLFGLGLWGMVNMAIFMGIAAGLASLLLQFSAFFTIILAAVFFGERIAPPQVLAIFLAFLGLIGILASTDGSMPLGAALMVVAAALCWSLCNLLVRRYRPDDMFAFVIWSGAFAVLPLFALTWLAKGGAPFAALVRDANGSTVFSVLFQSYVTTIFGYWVWNSLLRKYPASTVAPVSLLVPPVAMLTSMLVFHERIGGLRLASAGVVLAGLLLFLLAPRVRAAFSAARG